MPIISLKTGTKSRSLLVGNTAFNPTSYESIATFTGNGSASSFTFSSIPSGYTHLQIRLIARGVRSFDTEQFYIRFNSDTGNNYAWHKIQADGGGVGAYNSSSTNVIYSFIMPANNSTANSVATSVIDILDFANTNKRKTVRVLGGYDANGSGYLDFTSGLWNNTAAITSVTVLSNGAFTSTSQFALYGIKGS